MRESNELWEPNFVVWDYVVRTRQNSNSPELELTRTQKSKTTPAFWTPAFCCVLRSAAFCQNYSCVLAAFWAPAFCILLRSDQNSKFCVLSKPSCVLLRSGILRSAAFCVLPRSGILLLAAFWDLRSCGQAQARTRDHAQSPRLTKAKHSLLPGIENHGLNVHPLPFWRTD